MDENLSKDNIHPEGEQIFLSSFNNAPNKEPTIEESQIIKCNTYDGIVHLEWEPTEPVTPLGQLPFFINFLKISNLYEEWVSDCPLKLKLKPNGNNIHSILGTLFLSVLSGQKRYAHITSIRNDSVNPPLLGMNKIISEDTARRAFKFENKLFPEYSKEWNESLFEWKTKCEKWQEKHLSRCYDELTNEPWILDLDTTIKPLYGNQEGAEIGYNPEKPGRPAHIIHTYMMAQTRIILDAEVTPGKQSAAKYSLPRLLELIDSLPVNNKPNLIRGDCAFGSDLVLSGVEERNLNYLFKIKKTKNVKSLIDFVSHKSIDEWKDAGQGWFGIQGEIKLEGWKINRTVVILRRLLKKRGRGRPKKTNQLLLPFMNNTIGHEENKYEYSVLITNLKLDVFNIAQLYRDRASSENVFDELKNQWGWGGYVTQDILRTQITARIIAQVYNWWTMFTRLVIPDKHTESITSRPLLLYSVGRKTKHAGQTKITITPSHAKHKTTKQSIFDITRFLNYFNSCAEQVSLKERWILILSFVFRDFLKGKILGSIKSIPNWYYRLEFG